MKNKKLLLFFARFHGKQNFNDSFFLCVYFIHIFNVAQRQQRDRFETLN